MSTEQQQPSESPNLPALQLVPEVAVQLANGLEAVRNTIVGTQHKLEILAQQVELGQLTTDKSANNVHSISESVLLLSKDVERIERDINTINKMVIYGNGSSPMRERLTIAEGKIDKLEKWRDGEELDAKSGHRDEIRRHRDNDTQRRNNILMIIITISGWIVAIVGSIITAILSK